MEARPDEPARLPDATGPDVEWIIVCHEGYASSLAAVSLHDIGLHRATDLVGGFQAWAAAGLPVVRAADCAGPGIVPPASPT